MRTAARLVVGGVVWLAAAGLATAADADPLQTLAGRLAIQRAKALADKAFYPRAQAILGRLPQECPALADEAKKLAAELAEKAQAKKAPGLPAEYRTALERARRTGRPLLLFLGRDACGLCRFTRESLGDSKVTRCRRQFIEVSLNIDAPANRPLLAKFGQPGMSMLPFLFYVSPTEELLHHSSGAQDADALRAAMTTVLRKNGPPLSSSRRARAAKALKQANARMDAGRCGPALRTCRAIAKLKAKCQLVRDAQANVEIIEALAEALLARARQALGQQKLAEAVPCLLILQRDFAGTKAARAAAAQLQDLEAKPEAKAQIDSLTARHKDQPAKTEPPATEHAATAKPKPAASPRRAAGLLRMARNFLANHRADLAEPLLQRLTTDFPDAPAAKEAAKMLKELP